jgi:hypothetical protein
MGDLIPGDSFLSLGSQVYLIAFLYTLFIVFTILLNHQRLFILRLMPSSPQWEDLGGSLSLSLLPGIPTGRVFTAGISELSSAATSPHRASSDLDMA